MRVAKMYTQDTPVSIILDDVHNRMKARYLFKPAVDQDIVDANEIEDFLTILKERAATRKTKPPTVKIQNDIYDIILDNIHLPGRRTLGNLFTRTGRFAQEQGALFEDDFAAVIKAILDVIDPNQITSQVKLKDINIGSVVGTTDITALPNLIDQFSDTYMEEISQRTKEAFDNTKVRMVFGKIDTLIDKQLVSLNGEIDISPKLLSALSHASFTDKSYRSASYRDGQRIDLGDRQIHLGNSDPYRAVLGSMRSLGFSQNVTQHVFYGGRNIIDGLDSNPPPESPAPIRLHIYHLRFVYELTGAGILYENFGTELSSGAKFMVYNDPMSPMIKVVATSKIIYDLLDEDNKTLSFSGNPFQAISISTAYLKAVRNQS